MSLRAWAVVGMTIAVITVQEDRPVNGSQELEAATLPKKIYLQEAGGGFNYCFYLVLINRTADALSLAGAQVTCYMDGQVRKLEIWDPETFKKRSSSGGVLIRASERLFLRSTGEIPEGPGGRVSLHFRLNYRQSQGEGKDFEVEIPLHVYRQKGVFSLPFSGRWFVLNGHAPGEAHRLAARGQAFSWDFTYRKEGRDCRILEVLPERQLTNGDFYGFGQPVLAVADGEVVKAEGSRQDEVPTFVFSPYMLKTPQDPYEILGNYVVICHEGHEYSLVAHLQKDSVLVRAGDRVSRGQPIGRCGNSGDSTYPHIHFQVMNGPDHFRDEGIPVKMAHYGLINGESDRSIDAGSPRKGDFIENRALSTRRSK